MADKEATVRVCLVQGERSSGLSLMTSQYLEQILAGAPAKQRRARSLRGRLALEATDAKVTITVSFRGDRIDIEDGAVPPLDAYVGGPYVALTDLLAGRANPVMEHLHRRLRVRSSLRRPFFPYRVYSLLRLSHAPQRPWLPWAVGLLVVGGVSAAIALAIVLGGS
ncbi:MAG: SCP2 sterol-binding domain-containing protein [Dehalococcoidia bacterium]|nr:MAG: SCP2 sterol-binding domain-containing protein [Dehalococcoidia bacterium]